MFIIRKKKTILFILMFFLGFAGVSAFGQTGEVPRSMIRFAENELIQFSTKPEIVNAVQEQNNRGLTLDEIKAIDKTWSAYDEINRFMMNKISNDCALELWNFQLDHRYILEIFVMDNQGANVGQTNKTSDYWQGDEAKFTESFNNGSGAIHYGEPEYDASADELIIQISVPVMSGGRAVGAATYGISLDGWERR